MTSTTSTPFSDALAGQGELQPGQEGWWSVWGARVADLLPGDLIMTRGDAPGTYHEYAIIRPIPADGGIADMAQPRFVVAGEPDEGHDDRVMRFGALMPLVVLRRGTHRTLADSVR